MTAPCPFCGGVAVRDDHASTLADTRLHWMECKTCRARGPCASGRDAANAAWAARGPTAVEASQRALIDALEARLAVLFEGHSPKTPDVKLPDGSLWPHPECPALEESAWTAVHHPDRLTGGQAGHLLSLVAAYQHLATHPAGTDAAVAKLRALRRALRERGQR